MAEESYKDQKKFISELQKYFDAEANEIKSKDLESKDLPKGYTPEMRAMFLEFPDHLKACLTEIEAIEAQAQAEFAKENAEAKTNFTPEEIAKIIEAKRHSKLQKINKTIFTIACASDKAMAECLKFADLHGVQDVSGIQDISSFDANTGLSPLAAAMLRRGKPSAATKAMKMLVEAGANIFALSSPQKNSIAHLAALFGVDTKIIDHLVKQGVKFDQRNANGFTALDMAVGRRDAKYLQYLIDFAAAKFSFTPKRIQDAALGDSGTEEEIRKRMSVRMVEKNSPAIGAEEEKEKKITVLDDEKKKAVADPESAAAALDKATMAAVAMMADRDRKKEEGYQQQSTNNASQENDAAAQQQARQAEIENSDKRLKEQKIREQNLREEEMRTKLREIELRQIEHDPLKDKLQAGQSLLDRFVNGMTRFVHAIEATGSLVTYAIGGEVQEMREVVEEEFGVEIGGDKGAEAGGWLDMLKTQSANLRQEEAQKKQAAQKQDAPKLQSNLPSSPSSSPKGASHASLQEPRKTEAKFADAVKKGPDIATRVDAILSRSEVKAGGDVGMSR